MRNTLINGQFRDVIAVNDRGLQYGDGLFETLAVVDGQPCLWERHLTRLAEGCQRLGIPISDSRLLEREAQTLLTNCPQGVLKILVTRGSGGRGYNPPCAPKPTRILSLHPKPEYPSAWWHTGVRALLCQTTLGINPTLAGIKHTNRLEQILARAEWEDPDIAEGLMQNHAGHWIAGTKTNLFLVKSHSLLTPILTQCGVAGIMRNLVAECAKRDGLNVVEGTVKYNDLEQAQGIFITNSLIGIWPIRELMGRAYDPDALPLLQRMIWLKDKGLGFFS